MSAVENRLTGFVVFAYDFTAGFTAYVVSHLITTYIS
jgi:hypothetical protein